MALPSGGGHSIIIAAGVKNEIAAPGIAEAILGGRQSAAWTWA
jgi:hypothetical protein